MPVNIVTGFVQIFTQAGPSCQPGEWSPINVIQVGSSMTYQIFMVYQWQG